ncbi:conserved hypothetical protein [Pyrenophora tritici-repentis Pt-1C-BFP]|uniref:Uncharacterized protein n=1 Tax=Pyrenophora tritici-repentis (strain Pt-1C-BFP) TaxID=426418 RepID=B2WJT4_PYRTR|nr:uncharacterized protein PTRG_10431 [Pyrenophora tritici-repentis Pt-1C-BFP]EDU43481.1 conserved hypothetical protein [Pyrenophora tritici-repentis Pt-1C-BFP]
MKGLVTPASLDLFDFVYENPIQQMRSPGLNREDDLSRVVAQGTPRYFDASLFGESHLATGSGKEAFQEPGGLNTFIKAQHVIQIHRALLNPQKRSVQPTELYLLLVTITWGALLDTEVNTPVKADLADAVEDMTKLLFRHADSVDKFLALVAMVST